jgi:NAD(P)-dependent dehydrogenase (short-subunit alcohol dehydrogenase family)
VKKDIVKRIALITGGNRGIGRSAAEALADSGADVIITYHADAEEAEAVVNGIRNRGCTAIALRLDTTQHNTFGEFRDDLLTTLGEISAEAKFDILINNAGFDGRTPFGETDASTMDALYSVHVKGPILLTEMLAPSLRDGGRIVFLSTGLTRYVANPAYSVYASMKGAIEVYTKYAAKALGSRAITVNTLAPGATATDFGGGMIRDDDAYRAMVTRNHAFGRVGEPADIGGAIRAITASSANWITAQRIEASGGQSL